MPALQQNQSNTLLIKATHPLHPCGHWQANKIVYLSSTLRQDGFMTSVEPSTLPSRSSSLRYLTLTYCCLKTRTWGMMPRKLCNWSNISTITMPTYLLHIWRQTKTASARRTSPDNPSRSLLRGSTSVWTMRRRLAIQSHRHSLYVSHKDSLLIQESTRNIVGCVETSPPRHVQPYTPNLSRHRRTSGNSNRWPVSSATSQTPPLTPKNSLPTSRVRWGTSR